MYKHINDELEVGLATLIKKDEYNFDSFVGETILLTDEFQEISVTIPI